MRSLGEGRRLNWDIDVDEKARTPGKRNQVVEASDCN